jgi:SH3-like domain-containing protein
MEGRDMTMGKQGSSAAGAPGIGPFIPWVVILAFFGLALGGALGPGAASAPSLATAFVSTSGLNVRAGPGRDHSVLATLSQGDPVQLLGQEQTENGSTWVRVRTGGLDGWVSLRYLAGATGAAPRAPAAGPAAGTAPVRITLQYQRPGDLRAVSAVRSTLQGRGGWRVGAAERVLPAGDNRPETYGGVRFFFEADSTLARAVCAEVVAELARKGVAVTMPLWPMVTGQREGRFNATPGLIEVWIAPLPAAGAPLPPHVGRCGR